MDKLIVHTTKTWECRSVLRWAGKCSATGERILEQLWICPENGEREWRKVPEANNRGEL